MKPDKKYQKLQNELDQIIRAELNFRTANKLKKQIISKINETIETRNRQIVETHQRAEIHEILPSLVSGYLQMQEGGGLYLSPNNFDENDFESYVNKKGRFETLFTAAVMALDDSKLRDIVDEKRQVYMLNYERLKILLHMLQRVEEIQAQINMSSPEKTGYEKKVKAYLAELAPFRTELENIEAQCIEYQEDDYLQEAVKQLRQAVQFAFQKLTEKSQNASKVLFEQASSVFHSYKSTQVAIANINRFVDQKEELTRYSRIFESVADEDRCQKIQGFIGIVEGTIKKLHNDIERQKEQEAKVSEKREKETQEIYSQFLKIKEMYTQGQLDAESQHKNVGEKLKKYRDVLTANGQRILSLEVERFINATGLGRPPAPVSEDAPFDYKKAFYIVLPITIILLLMVLVLLIS